MKRKTKRIMQLITGLFAVLSLSVSSVAACTCSHHQAAPEAKKSCHGTSHHQSQTENVGSPNVGQSCNCIQPTSERSVKSEPFKLKKQLPVFSANETIAAAEYSITSSDPVGHRASFLYSSFSLDGAHSRGPPVL